MSFADYIEFWAAGLLVFSGLILVVMFFAGMVWFYRRARGEAQIEIDNERFRKQQAENPNLYRSFTATDED